MSYLEEIYSCLNEFRPSEMSLSALKMRDALIRKINSGDRLDADQLVEKMITYTGLSKFTREKVEIFTECGLAYYQMGDRDKCVRTLLIALANCSPDSHEQAILHWMVGEVHWDITTEQLSAMKTWEIAKEELDNLAIQADHENLPATRDWYRSSSDHLEVVLRERATTASFA